ncbi:hypothetical protein [uncultured Mediterranean phage uvMED]|nr:hypothetical protein [uncultured Mediterranean phage uvMED]|tara:strand:- start:319 stop:759 length:441 start_codon:yes stop_codon:yes gene_type:complete
MNEYDDTDKGVLWKPRGDQMLRAIGKVNNNGEDKNTLLMACATREGEKYYELYQKVSSIYAKKEDASEGAPDFSGPMGETRRIAMWVNEFPSGHKQEGTKYLKAVVSDKMQTEGETVAPATQEKSPEDIAKDIEKSFTDDGDEIPF